MAPIVLFAYNRPVHTRKTLESLSQNPEAANSLLYVFSDGPKPNADQAERDAIREVRKVIKSKDWCGKIVVHNSTTNKGLAASILDGVSKVIEEFGKVIVLEDDLVLSRGFLRFMNDALDLYEKDEQVMQISGFTLPVDKVLPATFFYSHATTWGWATWKRVWSQLILDDSVLLNTIKQEGREMEFNLGGAYSFSSQLEMNISGLINTWGIKLAGTIFVKKGLCLYPGRSLVRNIGLDNSGVHSGQDDTIRITSFPPSIKLQRIPLKLDKNAPKYFAAFYKQRERLLAGQTKQQLLTKLKQLFLKASGGA